MSLGVGGSIEVPKRKTQIGSAICHLESSINEANGQFAKLHERLNPICRTIAKPTGEVPTPELMVPLAETIESLACKVDSLITRISDTHEGLEL